jgi:hypothetical protein
MAKFFLLLSGLGLSVVGLSYGISPTGILPKGLAISDIGVELSHIFRALMCLYLGISAFWVMAAFKPAWTRPAIISVILFMAGLASGRILSIAVDGIPSALLLVYLGLELCLVLLGFYVLANQGERPSYKP